MDEMKVMDINCDLGEGAANDEALMPLISSCNIAAGGHAGNEKTIRKTIRLAKNCQVKIGVHPSYPDRIHFGRKIPDISPDELHRSLREQLHSFLKVADSEGIDINHIKLHGALYHQAASDKKTADIFLDTIKDFRFRGILFVPYGSVLFRMAERTFDCYSEAFIDRAYTANLKLLSRESPLALHHEPEKAWEQFYSISVENKVVTIEKVKKKLIAKTCCIHGDHPNAVAILKHIRNRANKNGIKIE
ncbi:MAG: LamB/YcsF family protein [Brumimicrobium sp.]|nr:LamB/YcsF family protein [Brumimicrobium sp.]